MIDTISVINTIIQQIKLKCGIEVFYSATPHSGNCAVVSFREVSSDNVIREAIIDISFISHSLSDSYSYFEKVRAEICGEKYGAMLIKYHQITNTYIDKFGVSVISAEFKLKTRSS